jgi:hypothetical protein
MATLQGIINSSLSLTQAQLKANRQLVIEIQVKLANLGFYPGGGWIDGDLGDSSSFTWNGLINFCNKVGGITTSSSTVAMDSTIAEKLLKTLQVNSVLNDAKNTNKTLDRLKVIQKSSPIVNKNTGVDSAFVSRSINNSPMQQLIDQYPSYLEQRPDGVSVAFYNSPTGLGDYPDLGNKPTNIDNASTALDFLSEDISNACICIGGFADNTSLIEVRWLGRDAFDTEEFLSATKFIGVLNAVCQVNKKSPNTDIDDCVIEFPRKRFNTLVKDLVSMAGEIAESNAIAAMFKRFTKREQLEKWLQGVTGNLALQFRGGYGVPPFIDSPQIKDTTTGSIVASFAAVGTSGSNSVSAYDLVRLISMLGWHPHLSATSQLPSAQWKSLESVARAMGHDTARYVDVALEMLGLVNVISEPVVLSKVGFGNSAMTYTAFVKFVDQSVTPHKLRTFALALRCPNSGSFDFCDTRLAAAVTEIIRRIVTEELI